MRETGAALVAEHVAMLEAASEWVMRAFGHAPGTAAHWRLVELVAAIRSAPAREAAEVMACVIDDGRAGLPPHDAWGDIRADAAWWADIATPPEIEAVVAAGLRRIDRALFAEAARKRLFVALWDAMAPADRRAFLARVDPEARFRGAAA